MLFNEPKEHRNTVCWWSTGDCTGFKDALEVYMSTAGTHYREFVEIFYDVRLPSPQCRCSLGPDMGIQ